MSGLQEARQGTRRDDAQPVAVRGRSPCIGGNGGMPSGMERAGLRATPDVDAGEAHVRLDAGRQTPRARKDMVIACHAQQMGFGNCFSSIAVVNLKSGNPTPKNH